jgi:hypothetical protein
MENAGTQGFCPQELTQLSGCNWFAGVPGLSGVSQQLSQMSEAGMNS